MLFQTTQTAKTSRASINLAEEERDPSPHAAPHHPKRRPPRVLLRVASKVRQTRVLGTRPVRERKRADNVTATMRRQIIFVLRRARTLTLRTMLLVLRSCYGRNDFKADCRYYPLPTIPRWLATRTTQLAPPFSSELIHGTRIRRPRTNSRNLQPK